MAQYYVFISSEGVATINGQAVPPVDGSAQTTVLDHLHRRAQELARPIEASVLDQEQQSALRLRVHPDGASELLDQVYDMTPDTPVQQAPVPQAPVHAPPPTIHVEPVPSASATTTAGAAPDASQMTGHFTIGPEVTGTATMEEDSTGEASTGFVDWETTILRVFADPDARPQQDAHPSASKPDSATRTATSEEVAPRTATARGIPAPTGLEDTESSPTAAAATEAPSSDAVPPSAQPPSEAPPSALAGDDSSPAEPVVGAPRATAVRPSSPTSPSAPLSQDVPPMPTSPPKPAVETSTGRLPQEETGSAASVIPAAPPPEPTQEQSERHEPTPPRPEREPAFTVERQPGAETGPSPLPAADPSAQHHPEVGEDDPAVTGSTDEPGGHAPASYAPEASVPPQEAQTPVPQAEPTPRQEASAPLHDPVTATPAPSAKTALATVGVPPQLAGAVARVVEAVADHNLQLAEDTVTELKQLAASTFGPEHPHTLETYGLEAYVAHLGGNQAHSTAISLRVAGLRLRQGDPRALEEVQRAAATWELLTAPHTAVPLGGELLTLWRRIIGADAAGDTVDIPEGIRAVESRLHAFVRVPAPLLARGLPLQKGAI
ncbi:hypothetical protein [Streptomyces flaveolus]|uniref:hypothetical protein n=1 Tax=Streptomyces flaveolus TaxID=67297 RepID=UPI0033F51BDD